MATAQDRDLAGVKVKGIVNDNRPPRLVYEPGHPDANADGYVAYPDINVVEEMANMTRAGSERPGLEHFQVRVNAALLPGSVSLESRDGLIDNSIADRFATVETIFAKLSAGAPDAS